MPRSTHEVSDGAAREHEGNGDGEQPGTRVTVAGAQVGRFALDLGGDSVQPSAQAGDVALSLSVLGVVLQQ